MMIRSTPPRSANLAEMPVPAPAPMIGLPRGHPLAQTGRSIGLTPDETACLLAPPAAYSLAYGYAG